MSNSSPLSVRSVRHSKGVLEWSRQCPADPVPFARLLRLGDPYPAYKELRATEPVCWNDVTKFWALLKYEDIRYVSTEPGTTSPRPVITLPDPAMPTPGSGRQPDLHRPTAPPAAPQTDQRRVHPPGWAVDLAVKIRELGLRNFSPTSRQVAPFEFAEAARRPAADPDHRPEVLGAPPADWAQFRGWSDAIVTGNCRSRDRARSVRGHGPSCSNISSTHRRAASETAFDDDMLSVSEHRRGRRGQADPTKTC